MIWEVLIFLSDNNLFFPEFGLSMTYAGFKNPTLKMYLVSLKYDFNELISLDLVHESVKQTKGVSVLTLHIRHEAYLFKLLGVAKWFRWLKISTANQTIL